MRNFRLSARASDPTIGKRSALGPPQVRGKMLPDLQEPTLKIRAVTHAFGALPLAAVRQPLLLLNLWVAMSAFGGIVGGVLGGVLS